MLLAILFITIGFASNHKTNMSRQYDIYHTSKVPTIKVGTQNNIHLSPNIQASDVPPSSTTGLQSQQNNPGEASTTPIQSNTDINSPSAQSNPLVQSVLAGSQQ